jgi:hypothetical protein
MLLQAPFSMRLFWSNYSERSGDVSRTCGPGRSRRPPTLITGFSSSFQPHHAHFCSVWCSWASSSVMLSPFQLAE